MIDSIFQTAIPIHKHIQSRGASRPSFEKTSAPKGRGECRVPDAPAASCAYGGSGGMRTSIHSEPPETTRHSRTQWLYGLYALSPVIALNCHRRLRIKGIVRPVGLARPPRDLTPASGARTTRFRRTHQRRSSGLPEAAHRFITRPATPSHTRRCRVHRIPPRVSDDRETPLQ